MKILSRILTLLAAILPLTACAADSEYTPESTAAQANGDKTIVVYFSCTNTTKGIAEKIAASLDCDTWRITPEEPYTAADLDYNSDCRANREQNDPAARPSISGTVDLDKYEVVYVGYPIWWGKLPKILWTFFDAYDLSGKTIIPFCTSGSSGISTSIGEIRSLEPAATVIDGRRFESNASQQTVTDWVNTVQPQTNHNAQNMTMNITIDGQTMTATLAENSSTAALVEHLLQGPVTYTANDYGSFEKVGDLGFSLPQNNKQVTTSPGDIILYQGTSLCLYYAQNSWNFTPMGKINYTSETELRNFLKAGRGQITVTLSMSETTGLSSVNSRSNTMGKNFNLNGTPATPDDKGVVIRNGKKILTPIGH